MFPPHLPPPFCSISRHQQWQRLKIVLVSTFFGLAAGLTGAAVMLGWIWPVLNGNDGSSFIGYRSSFTREQLQARAEAKINDKVFTVYKKATVLNKAYYFTPSDKLADGVMSLSSGWLTVYLPTYDGKTKDWVVVSQNGSIFNVEKSLFDKRTGIAFLKLNSNGDINQRAEQFKVATFNGDAEEFDDVFVYQDGRWINSAVLTKVPAMVDSHLDTVQPLAYNLNDSFKNGSITVDAQGNVIGFVSDRSVVLPVVNVNYFLSNIESKNQLTYPSFGIEGWYSEEKLLVIDEEKTTGFIVTKVLSNKQLFQKGDIVLEVNGRSANWGNLWSSAMGASARVKVWRSGRIFEGEANIIQL